MSVMTRVKELLERKGRTVYTIEPDASLAACAKEMTERSVGSLVVVDDAGRLAGIVTWHDVARIASEPPRLSSTTVAEVMTKDVEATSPDRLLKDVERLMVQRNIRHLPVVEHGKVVGIVTRLDVLAMYLSEADALSADLFAYIQGGYAG